MNIRFEGLLQKPGLIPGRKTKVWGTLHDKELLFYRENKRTSCIGSEELAEIKAVDFTDDSGGPDFKIITETKTTIFTAQDRHTCEQWVKQIQQAVNNLANENSDSFNRHSRFDKESVTIPKSPDKSVHNLVQQWQKPPETSKNISAKAPIEKKIYNPKESVAISASSTTYKFNSAILSVPTQNGESLKSTLISTNCQYDISGVTEEKTSIKRTDSGYETSDKRDSNSKSAEYKAEKTDNISHDNSIKDCEDVFLNRVDLNKATTETEVLDQKSAKHIDQNCTNIQNIVKIQTPQGVSEEVDISQVVLRRKSRSSLSQSSELGTTHIARDTDIREKLPSDEKHIQTSVMAANSESNHVSGNSDSILTSAQCSGMQNPKSVNLVTANGPSNLIEQNVVRMRKAPNKGTMNRNVMSEVIGIKTAKRDVVDGESGLLTEEQENMLMELTFDPLPELEPLVIDDIAETILEMDEILKGTVSRKSVRKSDITNSQSDELINEIKGILHS